jgi:hypothetical protein
MDWFEQLTGFREVDYEETRAKLAIEGRRLRSLVNARSYGIGEFELVSLQTLRERLAAGAGASGRLKVSVVSGDVRQMHRNPEYAGALFQVASQFNALEMIGPNVTPEQGVTRYQGDHTQGPACAIAAGAATIYRNYFVPVGDSGVGQTAKRQLDGLVDIGDALSRALGKPVGALWRMQNGYALCEEPSLDVISGHLATLSPEAIDALRGKLRIGVQHDLEVTDAPGENRPQVSQAFCSALPVAYTRVPSRKWRAFALLVLEAAYEATLLTAALNARRGASNIVLLTLLGGGAFGNDDDWILAAMRRALELVSTFDVDVKIVSYRAPQQALERFVESFR